MADRHERLRREASRDDYTSIARLAQALYENGADPREVLRQCYGVPFPEEFFLVAEADRGVRASLLGYSRFLPWELAIPWERGGLSLVSTLFNDDAEQEILARDPDLIPLLVCESSIHLFAWGFTGSALCYRLSELEAGWTTVFRTHSSHSGVDLDPDVEPNEIVRCGDSLLATLREHHAADLAGIEWAVRRSANQFGGGSATAGDIEVAQSTLTDLQEMQRRVARRHAR